MSSILSHLKAKNPEKPTIFEKIQAFRSYIRREESEKIKARRRRQIEKGLIQVSKE